MRGRSAVPRTSTVASGIDELDEWPRIEAQGLRVRARPDGACRDVRILDRMYLQLHVYRRLPTVLAVWPASKCSCEYVQVSASYIWLRNRSYRPMTHVLVQVFKNGIRKDRQEPLGATWCNEPISNLHMPCYRGWGYMHFCG